MCTERPDLHYGKVASYSAEMPRRKPGALLPLEIEILRAAQSNLRRGDVTFHGFGLAQSMSDDGGGRLIGHGTLYKALGRLEDMGLLSSQWEDDPPHGRPRRRLYQLTTAGARVTLAPTAVKGGPTVPSLLAPGTT